MVTVYAQHTTMAGRVVLDHDDDCTSNDHWHIGPAPEAVQWAVEHLDQQGAGTAEYHRRAARNILNYCGACPHGYMPEDGECLGCAEPVAACTCLQRICY